MNIIRTKNSGCYAIKKNPLGTYLLKIEDPDPQAVRDDVVNNFVVSKNAPRIPSDIWSALVDLYFHFHKRKKEVCVVFLYNMATEEWKGIVPKQEVDGVSVTKDGHKGCDLLTGEYLADYMDTSEGFEYMGDSHLHPFNMPNFSSTDDTNELGNPGIHVLISSIDLVKNTYVITSSIVAGRKRYIIKKNEALIDLSSSEETFHATCLKYVEDKKVLIGKYGKYNKPGKVASKVANKVVNYNDGFNNIPGYALSSYGLSAIDNYVDRLDDCWYMEYYTEQAKDELKSVIEELALSYSKEEIMGMVTNNLGDIYGL
jgi:hypothetical protein